MQAKFANWTRLAPSPTGALHLGNARSFLINWALARKLGWGVHLRIEDIDQPRTKPGAGDQAIADLDWLGIDWDGPITYQTDNKDFYHSALKKLDNQGLVYPCTCTRSEIAQAQSAPHADQKELRYPGTCRPNLQAQSSLGGQRFSQNISLLENSACAWRVRVPNKMVCFDDMVAGKQSFDVQAQVGDFIVASKSGQPSYQLAVAVDDARQNVKHVVRGDDLLPSAARQLWIYKLLELGSAPYYYHLPLVVGEDGRRLAKRHGDTRIAWYRNQGVSAQRVIGLIGYWSGAIQKRRPMSNSEFCQQFSLKQLPKKPVVFTSEDHKWLLSEQCRMDK